MPNPIGMNSFPQSMQKEPFVRSLATMPIAKQQEMFSFFATFDKNKNGIFDEEELPELQATIATMSTLVGNASGDFFARKDARPTPTQPREKLYPNTMDARIIKDAKKHAITWFGKELDN